MIVPIFARPDRVFPLAARDAFRALLDQYKVPYPLWGDAERTSEEVFEEHWQEIENNDAVYTTGSRHYEPQCLVRFIITLAMHVVMKHPTLGMLVLIEFVREGAFYRPRKHATSSLSEKAKLTPAGVVNEPFVTTIARCLLEEPRIDVEEVRLEPGVHFWSWPSPQPLVGGAAHIEQDYKKRQETPGLSTFNQVGHCTAYLPEDCYFEGWRQDAATRYLSRWVSLTEKERRLDPVPVDSIDLLV